jgi:hypothetical protein
VSAFLSTGSDSIYGLAERGGEQGGTRARCPTMPKNRH